MQIAVVNNADAIRVERSLYIISPELGQGLRREIAAGSARESMIVDGAYGSEGACYSVESRRESAFPQGLKPTLILVGLCTG